MKPRLLSSNLAISANRADALAKFNFKGLAQAGNFRQAFFSALC